MLFGTAKKLNRFDGNELNLSVNKCCINTKITYKYLGAHLDPTLNLDIHFYKTYKKAAGRVNLLGCWVKSVLTLTSLALNEYTGQ